jgi:hypothetical protein
MISVLLSGSIQRKEKEVQDRADQERRRVLDEQNWQQQKDQVECGHIAHIKPISKKQIPEKYPYTVGLFLVGIFGWCKNLQQNFVCKSFTFREFNPPTSPCRIEEVS